ncbi:MAG: hypothetical protein FVQ85_17480 [Planctomycetes bacterium]|nr:hypothetical protein [Planctomycetota bacterium]
MKSRKRKIGLIVLFLLVFFIGYWLGVVTSSYAYYRHIFSKAVDRSATELAMQIRPVCHLRLGEVDAAIKALDGMIDNNIIAVAQTPLIPITDYRHRVLRAAKTYREIYPSKSGFAPKVDDALRDIPKLETFKCENSLARLVKLAKSQEDQ